MDAILPDLTALPRLRRDNVDIQAIVAGILDEVTEIELAWDSIRNLKYDLIYSPQGMPGVSWVLDSTHTGTGGRMVVIRNIVKAEPKRIYQIVTHVPEGSEPIVKAYVNFNGSSVLLEWNFLGAPAAGNPKFKVVRNGQLLATPPAATLNYLDTTVASGQTYTYQVQYFAN